MTSACVLLATESVANLGFFDLFSKSTLFVSAGVLARIASVLLGGGMRLFPGGSIHLRIAILFILGLAAAPVAISVVQVQNVKEESFFPMMLSELLVGGCLGLSISFLVTVFESVGSVFANVTGLNWADVFTPGGSGGPGVTRLCGWVGLASFVLAGGQQFVVAGLIDSFLQMPVGALAGTNESLVEIFDAPVSIQSLRTVATISFFKVYKRFFEDKMGNSNSTLSAEIDMENRTVREK